jgi:ABC-2 type transport system ATP-binding protein
MELVLENVSKTFKKVEAVKPLNIVLDNGIHALLGANGSGKTTLMKIICGLLQAKGTIHLDDIDIQKEYDTFASHIGYMPQHFGYYPHYSVKEFLEYMAVVKNLNKDYSQKRIIELAKIMNLEDKLNVKMKKLSGGMLRRVGIIQALLNDPDVLILDEPTAGLDPKERIVFRNFIASLSQNKIILLSTHIVSDIETIADDILIMREGEIIMHGVYEDLIKIIQDKVWEVTLPQKEALVLMQQNRIVKSHNKGQEVFMRIVSDKKPHKQADLVCPDLDDLYIYYFEENSYVDTTY